MPNGTTQKKENNKKKRQEKDKRDLKSMNSMTQNAIKLIENHLTCFGGWMNGMAFQPRQLPSEKKFHVGNKNYLNN